MPVNAPLKGDGGGLFQGITYAGLLNECEEAFYMLCEGVRQSLAEVSECIWPLAVSHAAAECGVLLPH